MRLILIVLNASLIGCADTSVSPSRFEVPLVVRVVDQFDRPIAGAELFRAFPELPVIPIGKTNDDGRVLTFVPFNEWIYIGASLTPEHWRTFTCGFFIRNAEGKVTRRGETWVLQVEPFACP